MEFKVGDKVKIKNACSGTEQDKIYTLKLEDVKGNNKGYLWAWDEEVRRNRGSGCSCQENWELVEELINNNNVMTNIKEFFQNITASKEEKMLKEMGIENPIGTPTQEGLELSALITYKANRKEIAAICEQKKAEQEIEVK